MSCPAIRIYSTCVHCYPGVWQGCARRGHGFRKAEADDEHAQEAQSCAREVWIVTLGSRCDAGIAATLEHRADKKIMVAAQASCNTAAGSSLKVKAVKPLKN